MPRPVGYRLTTSTSATLVAILTIGGGSSVVGDGRWWSIKEVMAHLADAGRPVSDTTVRSMLAKDYLRGWYTEPGRHARIEPASVDELIPLLHLRLGPERVAALEALAERNRRLRGGVEEANG